MSNEAKTVTVKVVYLPNETPNVRLESPLMQNGLLTFRNDYHDGFWVKFVLDDVSLKGYRFANTAMSPMFSALLVNGQPSCPTSGVWPKFKPHDVEERTLTVRNKNGKLPNGEEEERFAFTLRVTKDAAGNGPVIDLDPGGVNQNGPVKSRTTAAAFLAGAAFGVLATLGTQAYLLPG